jgi:hypothetical protein
MSVMLGGAYAQYLFRSSSAAVQDVAVMEKVSVKGKVSYFPTCVFDDFDLGTLSSILDSRCCVTVLF